MTDANWDDIFIFLERYSGVTYDFDDDLKSIEGNEIFIDTYHWKETIDMTLERLEDALDCLDDFGDDLPDYLPGKLELKKFISNSVLTKIMRNVNNVKRILGIKITGFDGYDGLTEQVYNISELVSAMVDSTVEDVMKSDIFESDGDEDSIVEALDIHKRDIPVMCMTVRSIREDYYASLDEMDD